MNEITEEQRNADIEHIKAMVKLSSIECLVNHQAIARPCPCLSMPSEVIEKYDKARNKYRVICSKCQARTRFYRDANMAWHMWTRHILAVE